MNKSVRCRIVARDCDLKTEEGLFAGTPPLEALEILLTDVTTSSKKGLMINDISRAFFYAEALRPIYVEIPPEAREPGDDQMCWELNMSMYGTRDAAVNWHDTYSQHLRDIGYRQCRTNPCLFYHKERELRTLVHGDE